MAELVQRSGITPRTSRARVRKRHPSVRSRKSPGSHSRHRLPRKIPGSAQPACARPTAITSGADRSRAAMPTRSSRRADRCPTSPLFSKIPDASYRASKQKSLAASSRVLEDTHARPRPDAQRSPVTTASPGRVAEKMAKATGHPRSADKFNCRGNPRRAAGPRGAFKDEVSRWSSRRRGDNVLRPTPDPGDPTPKRCQLRRSSKQLRHHHRRQRLPAHAAPRVLLMSEERRRRWGSTDRLHRTTLSAPPTRSTVAPGPRLRHEIALERAKVKLEEIGVIECRQPARAGAVENPVDRLQKIARKSAAARAGGQIDPERSRTGGRHRPRPPLGATAPPRHHR